MVDLTPDLLLIMLEEGLLSYDDFVHRSPTIPPEYATYALFIKNRGKVSDRLIKQAEWRREAILRGLID